MIAVFSPKDGVGKTTLAVNLAWAAAALSSRRTLLWDLDAQGAASFILAPGRAAGPDAREVIERTVPPERAIVRTEVARLDLLPADPSLRALDLLLATIDAKRRLQRIGETLATRYDRIVVDVPPGLGPAADQVIRAASLIVMPVIPSPLATRAAEELRLHLDHRRKAPPPVLPVFNMVDRRRAAHRHALAAAPDQPAIPLSGHVEQMGERHMAVGQFAPHAAASKEVAALWARIERMLTGG